MNVIRTSFNFVERDLGLLFLKTLSETGAVRLQTLYASFFGFVITLLLLGELLLRVTTRLDIAVFFI